MKNDIDSLLNSIFSNGKLNFNNVVKQNHPSAEDILQKNMDDIAAMNESVRKELAQMDTQLKQDGLSSQTKTQNHFQPSTPQRSDVFENLESLVLEDVIGQDAFVHSLVRAFERPYLLGNETDSPISVIVLSGKPGTGRHTAIKNIASALAEAGKWKSVDISQIDCSLYPTSNEQKLFLQDLYVALQQETSILMFENLDGAAQNILGMLGELAADGELVLSSRYAVQKGMLVDVGTALVPNAIRSLSCAGKFLVFHTEKNENKLAAMFGTGFLSHVSAVCSTTAFSKEALLELSQREIDRIVTMAEARMNLSVSAENSVYEQLLSAYDEAVGVPSLAEAADRLYEAAGEFKLENRSAKALTFAAENNEFVLRTETGAIPVRTLLRAEFSGDMQAAKAEMDAIVGLEKVKEYIFSLEEICRVNTLRRTKGLKASPVSMHMIFAGNPGTGKTTIARLAAQYLKAAGALSEGQLVEVSRADLVGRYVGHTAPLTMQAVRSALGGVLFIDEAYALCRGEDDTFGLEAIDTLVKAMEDHRENLVVILAGYSKEMKEFLEANSGLRSRFPNHIEFPDYTGEELYKIAYSIAVSKGYTLNDACEVPLTGYFTTVQATDARTAGNGRLARNVVEDAILRQAKRVLRDENADLEALLPEDFCDILA